MCRIDGWGKCEETEQRSQTRQSSARCEHACVSVWSRRSRRDRHTSSSCPRASAAPAASAAATTACPRNTPSHTASLNPDKHTLHYSQFSPYSITVGHGLDSQGMHELQVKVQVALDESICQMHKCKLLFMDNFKNGKKRSHKQGLRPLHKSTCNSRCNYVLQLKHYWLQQVICVQTHKNRIYSHICWSIIISFMLKYFMAWLWLHTICQGIIHKNVMTRKYSLYMCVLYIDIYIIYIYYIYMCVCVFIIYLFIYLNIICSHLITWFTFLINA